MIMLKKTVLIYFAYYVRANMLGLFETKKIRKK